MHGDREAAAGGAVHLGAGDSAHMADLNESEVRALARALELPLTDADAAEVTHRLNAFIEALEPLMELDADGPEATPAPIDPDAA